MTYTLGIWIFSLMVVAGAAPETEPREPVMTLHLPVTFDSATTAAENLEACETQAKALQIYFGVRDSFLAVPFCVGPTT